MHVIGDCGVRSILSLGGQGEFILLAALAAWWNYNFMQIDWVYAFSIFWEVSHKLEFTTHLLSMILVAKDIFYEFYGIELASLAMFSLDHLSVRALSQIAEDLVICLDKLPNFLLNVIKVGSTCWLYVFHRWKWFHLFCLWKRFRNGKNQNFV